MFAHVADKVEEREVLHPVVVVDEFGAVWCVGVEVYDVRELAFDCFLIVAKSGFVEEFAFLAFHRWVANHTRSASHEDDRFMTAALEVLENHHTHEVADVERVGCGVNAEVGGGHLLGELFFGAWHDSVNHVAPFQFFNKIHV